MNRTSRMSILSLDFIAEIVENPECYRLAQNKLRIIQRTVSRRTMGGANRRKSILALQRHHESISNSRKDFLNQLAFQLTTGYDLLALEKLNIRGMVRNQHLSKSIMDTGWGYLSKRISDKAVEGHVVQINPAYTSETYSACGAKFENLTLANRWLDCSCGFSIDRDGNAAINILDRADTSDETKAQKHYSKAVSRSRRPFWACGVSSRPVLQE